MSYGSVFACGNVEQDLLVVFLCQFPCPQEKAPQGQFSRGVERLTECVDPAVTVEGIAAGFGIGDIEIQSANGHFLKEFFHAVSENIAYCRIAAVGHIGADDIVFCPLVAAG